MKLISVIELLAVVGASTVGNELQLKPEPELVEKYSGHWNSTIGINLEISQDFSAKFEFTILASGESKSTGWMRMERIVAEGEEFSVMNNYTISDMEVFDWASRMASYKFTASPKLVNIFSPSGSGVEIFIGGERVKLER
ncbi:hypothetical protein FOZ61_003104, partial [Perkinsus olseni]